MTRGVLLVLAVVFVLGSGYGLAHHDNGGLPFLVIGLAALVVVLWRRT